MNPRRFAPLAALAMSLSSQVWAKQTMDQDGKAIPSAEAGIAQLLADTNGAARVNLHDATGAARFVRLGSRTSALGRAAAKAPATIAATSQDLSRSRSREFFARHGAVFGIRDSVAELVEAKVDTDFLGGTHITYEQRHGGVPVFAGALKSHFNASGELTVVNGTFVPEINLDATPTLSARTASSTALNKVRADSEDTGLLVRRSELVVFREGLAKGVRGANHLAFRVEIGNGSDVREFVFIDAHSGKFIEQFTGIHDALNRRAYDGAGANPGPNYPGSPLWVEGQAFPTGVLEADNMILASGETHGLFSNAFGRDSFDGAGAIMHAIFNRGGAGQCPNASWNGEFISFCPGITTDDVTGHEWAHAYTEYTHNLIYAWQPGALNEAYSDIFGETIDRINARDAVVRPNTPRTDGVCSVFSPGGGTDNSERWLMGEDSTAVGLVGALRDMWNPTCYGDPGKVSDAQYTCDPAFTDQGGVHTNSGVVNHAYALLVDGGTYNSQVIAPIGLTKAAHIYFRAMNVYQTLASDFVDHADSLEASCTDLLGTNLADLSTGAPSGQIINAGDCTQVTTAILAVQLRTPPTACNFQPLLAQNPPNRCEVGATQTTALFENFEAGSAGWTATNVPVVPADFTARDWTRTNALPDGRAGFAFFGPNPNIGTCAAGGDESGVLRLESPNIVVPPGAAPRLTFDHWVATEPTWDGGNVKISVNGGPFTLIARVDYTFNPYNLTAMQTTAQGNTSPLQGQPGFSGTDAGSVSGSWGRSHVNLGPYALPGQTVKLRFDLGSDGCGGSFGWYVDDVSVHACVVNGPEIAVTGNAMNITDGDATPSLTDHTDFGTTNLTGGTVTRTFTIQNLGTGNLTIGALTIGGPDAADFTLTSAPPTSPVLPLGNTTFQITFDPSALGTRSATLSLVNDDPDENPFDFSIQGTGFTPPPFTVATVKEVDPNETSATAMALPVTSGGSVRVFGNVYPNADVDFYSFTATAGDRVYAATMTSASANGSSDSQLTLLASDGATVIEFDDDNGILGGFSSSIAGASIPATGTYYLKVNHFSLTSQLRGYDLYLHVRSGAPTPETESNDTPGTANAAAFGWISGARNPAVGTEQDWYSMTLNAGDTVFLSLDVDPERDTTSWNGRLGIALFGDAGNQILVADDAGTGDTAPQIPSEAMFMTVKDAGTYFAFVDSATAATGGPTATYNLSITVFPRVPVGVNPTTYTSTDIPKTIGPGAGLVSSTITVPGNPRIASIRVTLDLNHAQMNDLDVHLRSPAGNDIGIFTDIGSAAPLGQTQMVTTFADNAGVTPVFTALKGLVVRPEFAYRLYWLNGEDAGGTWTLDIRDDANVSGGTLNGWSLEISEMPTPPAGGTVFSTDFESGAAGFTHSGAADEWALGTPATAATTTANPIAAFTTANSGVNAWKTDLTGTYEISSSQDLLSPNISLSTAAGPITLTWAQKYQMQSATNDHAFVEVREVGGASPRKVWEWLDATMTDAPGNPAVNIGASAGWGLVRADISDFAGKNIEVRFHIDSDATINFGGWAIDDFSVSAVIAPSVTTPIAGSITPTSAILGGTVTTDNGSAVTERGVVYSRTSLEADPVIGAPNVTKVTSGAGLGAFTTPVSGLTLSTGYSFKAYATNAQGTGYTTPASTFTTPACPVITLAPLPNGIIGTAYTGAASALGGSGSYTYALTSGPGTLPPGLTLNPGTGALTTTPSATGTFNFQITATDTAPPGNCTGVANYTVHIGSVIAAGDLVIREFRFRGMLGDLDEYVEIANRSAGPLTIASTDVGSTGFDIASEPAGRLATIFNGTVIPAGGSYLAANSTPVVGYSLSNYGGLGLAAHNASWTTDVPVNSGVALFRSSTTLDMANRLDAVGFSGSDPLYREGTGLSPAAGIADSAEWVYLRKTPYPTSGMKDTGDNAADFRLVSTAASLFNPGPIRSALGSPGPQNLTSPRSVALPMTLADPSVSPNLAPNRTQVGNYHYFRRMYTNNTGSPITSLRFRILALSTLFGDGYVPGGIDWRGISTTDVSFVPSPGPASVTAMALTLEGPSVAYSATGRGGGYNASFSVDLSSLPLSSLANGASIYINIGFRNVKAGSFHFTILPEIVN